MKKYYIIIMAYMIVGLLFHTANAGDKYAQNAKRNLAAVTFSCLQFYDAEDREPYSRVTMVESSSENVPRPKLNENCTDYLVRLLSAGTSADNQNAPPFPNTSSCDALLDDKLYPPTDEDHENYENCKSFLIYGFW